jgi:hypothetical protein
VERLPQHSGEVKGKSSMKNMLAVDPAWLNIEVGQVLRAPNGRLRIVRAVHRSAPKKTGTVGRATIVMLSILRCSWTRRCYTVYSVAELAGSGYSITQARAKLKGPLNEKINDAIENHSCYPRCYDTVGIA